MAELGKPPQSIFHFLKLIQRSHRNADPDNWFCTIEWTKMSNARASMMSVCTRITIFPNKKGLF
jgi:hypothetical protein